MSIILDGLLLGLSVGIGFVGFAFILGFTAYVTDWIKQYIPK